MVGSCLADGCAVLLDRAQLEPVGRGPLRDDHCAKGAHVHDGCSVRRVSGARVASTSLVRGPLRYICMKSTTFERVLGTHMETFGEQFDACPQQVVGATACYISRSACYISA